MPLDDSTWGECDERRLTDDRLQDMIDATPCVVIECAIAHGKRMAEDFEREDGFEEGFGAGYAQGQRFAQGAGPSEAQEVDHSGQQAKRQAVQAETPRETPLSTERPGRLGKAAWWRPPLP